MPFHIVQTLFYKGRSEIDYVFLGLFFLCVCVVGSHMYSFGLWATVPVSQFLKILFLIMHVYVCASVYMSLGGFMHVTVVPVEARRAHQIWNFY